MSGSIPFTFFFFFFFNDTATTEIYTLSLHDALPISGRLELAVWLVPSSALVFLDFPPLPIGSEEPTDPQEHDSRDGHGDARSEHGPVEPPGTAVIGQVDEEPHQAEGDPDAQNRVEDPLAANVPPSFLQRFVHRMRIAPMRCALSTRSTSPLLVGPSPHFMPQQRASTSPPAAYASSHAYAHPSKVPCRRPSTFDCSGSKDVLPSICSTGCSHCTRPASLGASFRIFATAALHDLTHAAA